jgi:nitrogen-specific signal transduction histidine kinase
MESSCKIAKLGLVGMLHEMNNPLTSIKLSMELLNSCDEEQREAYVSIITRSIERLETSIRQIAGSFINDGYTVQIESQEPAYKKRV